MLQTRDIGEEILHLYDAPNALFNFNVSLVFNAMFVVIQQTGARCIIWNNGFDKPKVAGEGEL